MDSATLRPMKSQDIVVLLKLVDLPAGWTFEQLARDLEMSTSAVHRSLERAEHAGLYSSWSRTIDRRALTEFLVHGARYAFPPVRSGEARGVATAWAAPPLSDEIAASSGGSPVWPYGKGRSRGIALEPLHSSVPAVVTRDRGLWEKLALFDAIRIGSSRERNLAAKHLKKLLRKGRS